jgi:hypothetical protein
MLLVEWPHVVGHLPDKLQALSSTPQYHQTTPSQKKPTHTHINNNKTLD